MVEEITGDDGPAASSGRILQRPGKLGLLSELRRPKVAVMLALGFSSGMPFLLTGNTFGFWLRDEGVGLATIGFLSWVGLAYTLKVLWSPLIDRTERARARAAVRSSTCAATMHTCSGRSPSSAGAES